jgi:hypothetical protein
MSQKHKNNIPAVPVTVSKAQKGKKSVSWRNDPEILARLAQVAEMILKGERPYQIAKKFKSSLSTAKRDVVRVKTIWQEENRADIVDCKNRSVAQYRLIITKAWENYEKNGSPKYLSVILGAQGKIDEIEGNLSAREVNLNVVDIETIRKKRWDAVASTLNDVLEENEDITNDTDA